MNVTVTIPLRLLVLLCTLGVGGLSLSVIWLVEFMGAFVRPKRAALRNHDDADELVAKVVAS